jgi:hypothetical protein
VPSRALDAPAWQGRRVGQHFDVRLTAEDSHQTAAATLPPPLRLILMSSSRLSGSTTARRPHS